MSESKKHDGEPSSPLLPDAQPYTARLAAAGSRRSELEALLTAAPANAGPGEFRLLVIEANAVGKSTAASRDKVWQQLRKSYVLDPAVPEYRAFAAAIRQTQSPRERGLVCFLMFARTDRLFRELTLDRVSPLSAKQGAVVNAQATEEYMANLARRQGFVWTTATLGTVQRHLLSALKDFGILEGSAKKRTVTPRPGPATTLFAARLGRLEGLADRQVLDCVWFRLLGMTTERAVELLYEASRAGALGFRMQAGVVELDLPALEAL